LVTSSAPGDSPLNAYLLSLVTASAPGEGLLNLLIPGNTDWARPGNAHLSVFDFVLSMSLVTASAPDDSPLNAYLLSLTTASAPGDSPRNLCGDRDRDSVSFIFGDSQRTWLQPAQFVNTR